MDEIEQKTPKMSDCASCGKAMDFNPDDTKHEFEVLCEHCRTINIVTWDIDRPGRWFTTVKPGRI